MMIVFCQNQNVRQLNVCPELMTFLLYFKWNMKNFHQWKWRISRKLPTKLHQIKQWTKLKKQFGSLYVKEQLQKKVKFIFAAYRNNRINHGINGFVACEQSNSCTASRAILALKAIYKSAKWNCCVFLYKKKTNSTEITFYVALWA